MLITYPYAYNLSASGLLESLAEPPESQARTCGGIHGRAGQRALQGPARIPSAHLWWDPWARRATCAVEPSQDSKRAPVVGSMGAEGPGSARNSSYRLVSMATRQPVVPQILKE